MIISEFEEEGEHKLQWNHWSEFYFLKFCDILCYSFLYAVSNEMFM